MTQMSGATRVMKQAVEINFQIVISGRAIVNLSLPAMSVRQITSY